MSAETESVKITVDPDMKRRIRLEAARRDKSMAELGRDVLREWVEEHAEN